MPVCFVVESNEKKAAIESALIDNPEGHVVIATQGKLYAQVWGKPPLSTSSYLPVNNYTIPKTLNAINQSDLIYLATDMDGQGELLAEELAELCKKNNKPWKRAAIYEIDADSVLFAIDNATDKINHLMANKASLYSLYDYALSNSLSDTSKGLIIGRCSTPLLNLVAEQDYYRTITHEKHNGFNNSSWVKANQDPHIASFSDSQQITITDGNADILGYSLCDLAIGVCESIPELNLNVLHDTLERMYLNGDISYFRTASNTISETQNKALRGAYHSKGWQWLPSVGDTRNLAHGAIIPYHFNRDLHNELESAVLQVLESHYDQCSGSEGLSMGSLNDKLFIRHNFYIERKNELDGLETKSAQLNSSLVKTLWGSKLCKPSTVLSLAEKCKNDIVSNGGQLVLKGHGHKKIRHVKNKFPRLFNEDHHQLLNDLFSIDQPFGKTKQIELINRNRSDILPLRERINNDNRFTIKQG